MTAPAEQGVTARWSALTAEKLDWAFRGYGQFLGSLHHHTRACFAGVRDDVAVVLFGRTQVGKTTLLLTLLGIRPDHLSHVGRLLRGGRESGRSATATAMEYGPSSDDRWRISIGASVEATDEAGIVNELARIRSMVESGQFAETEPVRLAIPLSFFNTDVSTRFQVRILDLPGDNPRNQEEALHVRAVAQRYVPDADLVLIVGRADDLSFLNPAAFDLPGIRDWRFAPGRFRIVTTYSFTLQSLKEWASSQATVTVDSLRQRLISQLSTHDVNLNRQAHGPGMFFPLEFGDSWRSMQERDPALYRKIAPCVDQMMAQLIADIRAAASPIGRLRQARNTHIIAGQVKDAVLSSMRKEESVLAERCEAVRRQIDAMEAHIERTDRKIRSLPTCPASDEVMGPFKKLITSVQPASPGKSVEEFQVVIQKFIADLAAAACAITTHVSGSLTIRNPLEGKQQAVIGVVEPCFAELSKTLDDYWLDSYWSEDSHAADMKSLRMACDAGRKAVIELAGERCDRELRRLSESAAADRRRLETQKIARREAHRRLHAQEAQVRAALAEKRRELEVFLSAMDADMERSRQFSSVINDACRLELVQRRRRILNAESPADRWLQLAGSLLVCRQRRKLLDGEGI